VNRAEREVEAVDKRCQTILKLLPDVTDEERSNELKAQLDKLLRALTPGESPGPPYTSAW